MLTLSTGDTVQATRLTSVVMKEEDRDNVEIQLSSRTVLQVVYRSAYIKVSRRSRRVLDGMWMIKYRNANEPRLKYCIFPFLHHTSTSVSAWVAAGCLISGSECYDAAPAIFKKKIFQRGPRRRGGGGLRGLRYSNRELLFPLVFLTGGFRANFVNNDTWLSQGVIQLRSTYYITLHGIHLHSHACILYNTSAYTRRLACQ